MSNCFTISQGTGIFYLPLHFDLQLGGELVGAQVAFEISGPDDAPVVLVLGGISAGRHITSTACNPSAGWWQDLVGPGRAIDTDRYRVLGIDYLGGVGASTGPSNGQGSQDFPLVTSQDQARAIRLLLEHLDIDQLHRFVGSSYGGMVGMALAIEYPDSLAGLVAIGAAHESHPMASAWRSLQRRIVELGIEAGDEKTAVALARGLAMTTYRSHEEFAQRFASEPREVNGRVRLPVEDYLDARGGDFAARFSAQEFLSLSQAIDLHRVDPTEIRVPTLLVGLTSDQLVPIEQVEELAAKLERGRLVRLPSLFGHDGFLKEVKTLTPVLRDALRGEIL